MKKLLDENIDVRFKNIFANSPHEVYTMRDMHWTGIKNGTLLELLKEHGFNCWIVVDKNIPYQQNISKLPCTIMVLDVFRNTLEHITSLLPELLATIDGLSENKVIESKFVDLYFENENGEKIKRNGYSQINNLITYSFSEKPNPNWKLVLNIENNASVKKVSFNLTNIELP